MPNDTATTTTNTNADPHPHTVILQEQRKLAATEREICGMLDLINQQLNQLRVEELQLRSNEISQMQFQTATDEQCATILPFSLDSAQEINSQQLQLDAPNDCKRFKSERSAQVGLIQKIEEFDDDDEESD